MKAVAFLNVETEESGKDFNEHTDLDQYIEKHTVKNVVTIKKKENDKEQVNRQNFLRSSFYTKKKYITEGFLGKDGLR